MTFNFFQYQHFWWQFPRKNWFFFIITKKRNNLFDGVAILCFEKMVNMAGWCFKIHNFSSWNQIKNLVETSHSSLMNLRYYQTDTENLSSWESQFFSKIFFCCWNLFEFFKLWPHNFREMFRKFRFFGMFQQTIRHHIFPWQKQCHLH